MSLIKFQNDALTHFENSQGGQAFDPTIIMMIAELIMQMVIVLQENCGQPTGPATTIVNNPTRIQSRWLRRKVRRELGRREYRQYGRGVYNSLLHAGNQASESEMQVAYDEVNYLGI